MRLIILTILFVLFVVPLAFAAEPGDPDFVCTPTIQECGCGGTQTRYTLPGRVGCSDWYPCSVSDVETDCEDGFDNDCDNLIDCADSDCDSVVVCIDDDSDGFFADVDCDDSNPSVYPDAVEVCNGLDDDCDGDVDEFIERECGSSDQGVCEFGVEFCFYGNWQGCNAVRPVTEVCGNSLDDDCDGLVDENCSVVSDPVEIPTNSTIVFNETEPVQNISVPIVESKSEVVVDKSNIDDRFKSNVEKPVNISNLPKRPCVDDDGDGFGLYCRNGLDCDDFDVSVHPGVKEVCNGRDDNCDGFVDENLEQQCGVSRVGNCFFGVEHCEAGKWVGCNAVFPSAEVCGNSLDDDCDGDVDEGCKTHDLSDEELALDQFLAIEYGENNYDLDSILDAKRRTKNFIVTQKSSVVEDGKTTINIVIRPKKTLYNFSVYEYIHKSVAESVSEIEFKVQPVVIQDDPLVAWHFAVLDNPVDLSYELKKEVEGAASRTSTISFAEEVALEEDADYVAYIPLFFLPIIGLLFIVLVEAIKRKTHND